MEMCPSCGELRNMVVSSSTQIIKADGQQEKKIKILSYHCEKCNKFMRSEELDEETSQ